MTADVEQKLRDAIAKVMADGWKLRRGVTLDPTSKCCCPFGAYALVNRLDIVPGRDDGFFRIVSGHLGINEVESGFVVYGFDMSRPVPLLPYTHPLFQIGIRLAAEFCKT